MRERDEFELDDHEELDVDGDDEEDTAEREEGAGLMYRGMSMNQVRQIMRMESYCVQNTLPPPPMPGCSRLGCDHGKIRTPGGFDWCLCAKKVKVLGAIGPFASVTFNAEATKSVGQAGQSRVLLVTGRD